MKAGRELAGSVDRRSVWRQRDPVSVGPKLVAAMRPSDCINEVCISVTSTGWCLSWCTWIQNATRATSIRRTTVPSTQPTVVMSSEEPAATADWEGDAIS